MSQKTKMHLFPNIENPDQTAQIQLEQDLHLCTFISLMFVLDNTL